MATTGSDKRKTTLVTDKSKTTVNHTLRNTVLTLSAAAMLTLEGCSKPSTNDILQRPLGRQAAPIELTPAQKDNMLAADKDALTDMGKQLQSKDNTIADLKNQVATLKTQNANNQAPANNQPVNNQPQQSAPQANTQQNAPVDNSQQQAPQDNTQQNSGSAVWNPAYAQPIQVPVYGYVPPCPIYPLYSGFAIAGPYCYGISPIGYPYIWGLQGGFLFWGRERTTIIINNNNGGNNRSNTTSQNNNNNTTSTKNNSGSTTTNNGNTGTSTKNNGTQNTGKPQANNGYKPFSGQSTQNLRNNAVQQFHDNRNLMRPSQQAPRQPTYQHPSFQGNPNFARPQPQFNPNYGRQSGGAQQAPHFNGNSGGGGNRGGGGGGSRHK